MVSPLAPVTITFRARGWSSSDGESAAVFNAYVKAGGNFIDNAHVYGGGRSEVMIEEFIAQRDLVTAGF